MVLSYGKVLATAACLVAAAAANASGPLDLSSGSTSFGGTPSAGSFSEVWTFTLASAPILVTGSVTSAVNGTQDVDFTSITITGSSISVSFTSVLGDPFELWTISTILPAGNYSLTLTGTNSASMGSYAANLGVTVVPEPSQYVLFLAGLAGIGVVLRRKRA